MIRIGVGSSFTLKEFPNNNPTSMLVQLAEYSYTMGGSLVQIQYMFSNHSYFYIELESSMGNRSPHLEDGNGG